MRNDSAALLTISLPSVRRPKGAVRARLRVKLKEGATFFFFDRQKKPTLKTSRFVFLDTCPRKKNSKSGLKSPLLRLLGLNGLPAVVAPAPLQCSLIQDEEILICFLAHTGLGSSRALPGTSEPPWQRGAISWRTSWRARGRMSKVLKELSGRKIWKCPWTWWGVSTRPVAPWGRETVGLRRAWDPQPALMRLIVRPGRRCGPPRRLRCASRRRAFQTARPPWQTQPRGAKREGTRLPATPAETACARVQVPWGGAPTMSAQAGAVSFTKCRA